MPSASVAMGPYAPAALPSENDAGAPLSVVTSKLRDLSLSL
eukprot:CAMPEP_0113314634 /NCGR_PEP_ID=MMETSP0010_2-20120614/10615_1 /TAXON_ID=216773 ORGANISM="Corethron hystrix, Strain 308" /NCGR_SAMPLE_ID=MMETSP0010_2 /ASSEMBLY_ACC=CAM_ASM_000155 /LENGTH=40 /DNA_ID=CAMNT_0000170957 /DNA_START=356 /DNA_END=475 /DNA_ORIENTATION=- /assembly_acc=CAM_ASM_000155